MADKKGVAKAAAPPSPQTGSVSDIRCEPVYRNSWWATPDHKRLFVITRLCYGNGHIHMPTAYEVFEKGNIDSPMEIEARVWVDMVVKAGLIPIY
jgi:hypothetical protein